MSAAALERPEVDRRALLLRWLYVDAAVSGASGVALAAGSPWLDGVLAAPVAFLVPLGVFLVAYAESLWMIARAGAPRKLAAAVIAGNALWTIMSVIAVVADWLTLSGTGDALALVQAAAVAFVAERQLAGLRRSTA